jgi:hypothetical protein
MHSCCDYDAFPLRKCLRVRFGCDREHLTLVPRQRVAKILALTERGLDRIRHDLVQVFKHISIGIRITVSKIDRVVSVLEGVGERVRVVVSRVVGLFIVAFANLVLVVRDLCTAAVPADVLQRGYAL